MGVQGYLAHRTRRSGLRLAAAMTHVCDAPKPWETETESYEDSARVTVIAELKPGEKVRLVKLVAYGWSAERSVPALRDQVAAALAAAGHTGWDGMLAEQKQYLDDFWAHADVHVDGDPEIQQAVRFGVFQILQAGARAEGRAIPAKGLTGPGYDGHAFWDTESYVLPVLTYTLPTAAADAIRWRHSILPQACERAKQLGLKGAAFPWRTIAGEECSAYWPAGTAAFHVTADVADAVARFQLVAGSPDYARRFVIEMLVETARLWASLGYFDANGEFRIDGVTGPDEYSAIADNNVYTNLMAKRNLLAAVAVLQGPDADRSDWPDVDDDELETWQRAADHMRLPYDERLDVHPQADDFTSHAVWDFDGTTPRPVPAAAELPVLRPVPQAGGQAGRPGHGPVPGQPRVHRRAEAARLRVLRAADRPRLLAVGVRAGHHRGRDRAPGPGLRLLGRGRPDGPRRPGAQHRRRPAHRVAGRGLAGGGVRVRRAARHAWTACRRSRPGCPAR